VEYAVSTGKVRKQAEMAFKRGNREVAYHYLYIKSKKGENKKAIHKLSANGFLEKELIKK
jgi:hypothetical protein